MRKLYLALLLCASTAQAADFAQVKDGKSVLLKRNSPIVVNNAQYTLDLLDLAEANQAGWSIKALGALGIYAIVDDAIPAGKIAINSTLSFDGTIVHRVWTLIDIPVPTSVTRLQARLALLQTGKLATVEAAIAAADEQTRVWYEDSPVWHRDNPTLTGLAQKLGLSDADVDDLFKLAATLGQ